MGKLFRLVVKIRGDDVEIRSLRRAARGRYALHKTTAVKREDLRRVLASSEFQEANLIKPISTR